MRKTFMCAAMLLWCGCVAAQSADSYFVTTNNVKQSKESNAEKDEKKEEKTNNIINDNFPHRKLCEWTNEMRFMVMPEKMDMITGVFNDAETGKRVSCSLLRHKIMVYDGYEDNTTDNYSRIFFKCEGDGKRYFYQTPNGLFKDYCESKMEVPALAYLGDVDKARELFLGKKFMTQHARFRVDVNQRSDGYEEVARHVGEIVTVKKIGVGSRAYPVKFVLEDTVGHQFYQAVTISRTNCGMREEELGQDNVRFTFEGSFKYVDEKALVRQTSSAPAEKTQAQSPLVGKKVHLLRRTLMGTEYTTSESEWIKEYSGFTIERVAAMTGTEMVKLFLRSIKDKKIYTKQVSLQLMEDGKTDPGCSTCFANIFGDGDPLRDDPKFAARRRDSQIVVIENVYEREPLPIE